jgi:hypothetical protein
MVEEGISTILPLTISRMGPRLVCELLNQCYYHHSPHRCSARVVVGLNLSVPHCSHPLVGGPLSLVRRYNMFS